jgi:hypothetical protein
MVSTQDLNGLTNAVNSSRITLLSTGAAHVASLTGQAKAIDIQAPTENAYLSSGMVNVAGLTSLDPGQPLKVQLIDLQGKVLGQRLAGITGTAGAQFNPFSSQVSYKVEKQTPVRLVVYQDDLQTGLVLHLASIGLILEP